MNKKVKYGLCFSCKSSLIKCVVIQYTHKLQRNMLSMQNWQTYLGSNRNCRPPRAFSCSFFRREDVFCPSFSFAALQSSNFLLISCTVLGTHFLKKNKRSILYSKFFLQALTSLELFLCHNLSLVGVKTKRLAIIPLKVSSLCKDKLLIVFIWWQTLTKYWCMNNINVHPSLCHAIRCITFINHLQLLKPLWQTRSMKKKNSHQSCILCRKCTQHCEQGERLHLEVRHDQRPSESQLR